MCRVFHSRSVGRNRCLPSWTPLLMTNNGVATGLGVRGSCNRKQKSQTGDGPQSHRPNGSRLTTPPTHANTASDASLLQEATSPTATARPSRPVAAKASSRGMGANDDHPFLAPILSSERAMQVTDPFVSAFERVPMERNSHQTSDQRIKRSRAMVTAGDTGFWWVVRTIRSCRHVCEHRKSQMSCIKAG